MQQRTPCLSVLRPSRPDADLVAGHDAAGQPAAVGRSARPRQSRSIRSTWSSARAAALVQITETVPPEELFGEYAYFSSFSDAMLAHAQRAGRADHSRAQADAPQPGDRNRQQRRLPAAVLSDRPTCRCWASSRRPTLPSTPSASAAFPRCRASSRASWRSSIEECGQPADVVHAHNVLAHVADLNGFVAGLRTVLKPTGVAISSCECGVRRQRVAVLHDDLAVLRAGEVLQERERLAPVRAFHVDAGGAAVRHAATRADPRRAAAVPRPGAPSGSGSWEPARCTSGRSRSSPPCPGEPVQAGAAPSALR